MKKFHKAVTTVAVAALSAALCFSLAACGETEKAADLVASYNSSSYTFMTAFPNYTFKQLTTNVQNINVYDDNTYMLMVTTKSLSGDLKFDPSNSGDQVASANDRGCTITHYYGAYEKTEEDGMITLKLKKPTRVVYTATASATASAAVYYDTANWTDAMSGEGESAKTAEQYLASMAFADTECVVNGATFGFDYIDVSVKA